MSLFSKLLFILALITILPVCVMAQSGSSEPAAAEVEGLEVSVDLRLGGNVMLIIPGLSVVVGVPVSLSSDFITLVPMVGFQYNFDVLTDIHSSYYVPVGIAVVYNPMNIGAELFYYPPVGVTDGKYLMSAAAFTEMMLLEAGGFSMHLNFGLGPLFVLDGVDSRVMFRVNSAFLFRYSI